METIDNFSGFGWDIRCKKVSVSENSGVKGWQILTLDAPLVHRRDQVALQRTYGDYLSCHTTSADDVVTVYLGVSQVVFVPECFLNWVSWFEMLIFRRGN